jgi:dTMP kinase
MHPGVFIAFEGGEGSGKSTQIALLANGLRAQGRSVTVSFEPGATPAGRKIRAIVLESRDELNERAEALLFAADRAHHVATVVRPALDRGDVVLTDRYIDSSLAYQGEGRSLSVDEVRRLSAWATESLVPELTIVLDIAVAEGLARAAGRGAVDRLEAEPDAFHQRVRQAFLRYAAAEPQRYAVFDAGRGEPELATEIAKIVDELLVTR